MRPIHGLTLIALIAGSASAKAPHAAGHVSSNEGHATPAATVTLPGPVPLSTTLLVVTDILGTPPVDNINGTTSNPVLQINGTDNLNTGYLEFKYGANGKGISNVFVKTRGTAMNDYAVVQSGDRILTNIIQAGTGSQAGHLGSETWVVDGSAIMAGEVNGQWILSTGTGIASWMAAKTPYPNRYGVMDAIVANSFQQVYLPGGLGGTNGIATGDNFGGWLVIAAGAAAPGFGALKFRSAGAVTLTTPEPGAFEVDAGAVPYFTTGDGVRRTFALGDTGTPGVTVAAGAGNGATATVDASGSAGAITLVTGSMPVAGALLTLTYAHPYATASYPVFSFASASGPASAARAYVIATRSGFTLSDDTALAPNTTYVFTYQAPGR